MVGVRARAFQVAQRLRAAGSSKAPPAGKKRKGERGFRSFPSQFLSLASCQLLQLADDEPP